MQIAILTVGKLKDAHWRGAQAEYVRRLGAYARLTVQEVADEPDAAPIERVTEPEGKRLLALMRERDFVVALAIAGESLTSEALADKIQGLTAQGHGRYVFVIGGSSGLHSDVLKRADWQLSLSPLTLPHALARVVLLEQLYRSFRLISGAPYHK
ncbi:MAG: 23S rRNA (pseudouridine(1915)-N(3))-methyltransferase RlmH [Firmicutes bacterium]|nr:23S rRNA (pseudouridine(1915)-N(3))-methyltransferase RlmH [Bacillota bacterium]